MCVQVCAGEVIGVREGTISLLDWDVHAGCAWAKPRGLGRGCPHPGISLGRYRRAIAQAPFSGNPFQGSSNPEKPSGKKTPRGYRKGTDSPLARTTLFQEPSAPEKACTEKEKSKQDVHAGYAEGISLVGELGAVA